MITLRLCLVVSIAAWLGCGAASAAARIVVDGRDVPADVPPMTVAGTLLVPLRFIGEALGAAVSWDHRLKVATLRGNDRVVQARIGDGVIRANPVGTDTPGRAYTAEAAPRIIGGRIMLPLRAVGQALGAAVDWDERTRIVSVGTPRSAAVEAVPGGGGPARPPEGGASSALRVTLRTDKREYPMGERVQLTLEARNAGAAPITLQFSSSQRYDFEVRRGETVIWKWSDDRMFAQALGEVTLAPGGGATFVDFWPQRDRQGRPVEPGAYTVTGYLADRGRNGSRPSVTIQILAAPR